MYGWERGVVFRVVVRLVFNGTHALAAELKGIISNRSGAAGPNRLKDSNFEAFDAFGTLVAIPLVERPAPAGKHVARAGFVEGCNNYAQSGALRFRFLSNLPTAPVHFPQLCVGSAILIVHAPNELSSLPLILELKLLLVLAAARQPRSEGV